MAQLAENPPPSAPVTRTRRQASTDELRVNEYVNAAGATEKERHAGNLAVWLILMLGITLGVHYIATLVLICTSKSTESLDQIFHAWLPVVSGFVGSAVTYYFTRDRNGRF